MSDDISKPILQAWQLDREKELEKANTAYAETIVELEEKVKYRDAVIRCKDRELAELRDALNEIVGHLKNKRGFTPEMVDVYETLANKIEA